ncbi:MAG: DUF4124 domain-containing protein [Deltaproteobacteria bacterium]|jgi:uncharacterized membrane-anchored protein YjiN (DUF445 family)|nr:DUF4124 domain-containing protein [Deltaproteobacteria bacterium]
MKKFKNFLTLGAAFFLLTFIPFFLTSAGAAYYKYIDKNGTVHFTDRYESIPQEYRDQIKTIREEPKPQLPPPPTELHEKKRGGESAAEERPGKVQETEQKEPKEAEAIEARKKEAAEKKLKAIEEKEKRIEELQKQIEDKRKQQRSLRTNWMVQDRNIIIRLNQEISVLEKKIKAIQDELAEGK